MTHRIVAVLILMLCHAGPAQAQAYSTGADLLFYGDNTEFANPFREGETLLGVSGRVFLEVALGDAVKLRGGIFGLGRFGSHEFVEQGEPMIALEIGGGTSRFIFGSLETAATASTARGPDRETLHGLLPPLQQETLAFTRGQEMGLQWLIAGPRVDHDAWINWQRLNTSEHRERFDAGYRGSVRVAPAIALHGQWHLVHEGGQQFASGAVSDSQAFAAGAEWARTIGVTRVAIDGHLVTTRDAPDRERPALTQAGLGTFTRAAAERGAWRSHLIVWRGRDMLKAEGDANYLAARRDGTMFRKVRDYAELGITRHFSPAPGVDLFAAIRLHRIESFYEYSYRINARLHLRKHR